MKAEICAAWSICADDKAICQGYGVALGTLKKWKREAWWTELLSTIQSNQSRRLVAKANRACESALAALEERVELGDVAIHMTKEGPVEYRVPVKARDLSAVVNVLATRSERAAAMVQQQNTTHELADLQGAFRQFAKSYRAKQIEDTKAIEHQGNGHDVGPGPEEDTREAQ